MSANPFYFYLPLPNCCPQAAIAVNADCIITNDRDVNILKTKEFPSFMCFRLADFASVLTNF
jgi:hypothetical protein